MKRQNKRVVSTSTIVAVNAVREAAEEGVPQLADSRSARVAWAA